MAGSLEEIGGGPGGDAIRRFLNVAHNDDGTLKAAVVFSLDTDGTLAADSDTKVASQKATKTYVDTRAPSINVKATPYNAAGDNATDDTAAIQAAVNAAVAVGGRAYFPTATYKITAPINVPFGYGFVLEGESPYSSVISQWTADTPVFQFTNHGSNAVGIGSAAWRIRNLSFFYHSPQSGSAKPAIYFNPAAAATAYGGDAGPGSSYTQHHNFFVESCMFFNCSYCMGSPSGQDVWGFSMRDLFVDGTCTGGISTLPGGGGGMPNCRFEDIYIRADVMSGPLFLINGATSVWMTGIEINSANLGPVLIQDQGGGHWTIGTFRLEAATYSPGTGFGVMFALPNSALVAQHLQLSITAADTTSMSPACMFDFRTGGSPSPGFVRISQFDLLANSATPWTISGPNTYFLSNCNTGYFIVDDLPNGIKTGMQLTDIFAPTQAAVTEIRSWNRGRATANAGDADYTVTIGDPNVVIYKNVALTANRTVTLPQSNARGNMFEGLRYRVVVFNAQTASAPVLHKNSKTLAIADGANGTIATFTDANYPQGGAMEFVYRAADTQWVKIAGEVWA